MAKLDLALMARIATLYYLEDNSQAEIATRFGLSRIKVGRLLRSARDIGIVDIRINTPSVLSLDLETEIKHRFGLKQALLVPDQDSDEAERQMVGQMAASYLAPQVRQETVVAIGMGRNVAELANSVVRGHPVDCTFVGAIGGAEDIGPGLNSGDICRHLAQAFGGRAEILYAPAYARTREMRNSFLSHDSVRHVMDLATRAQIAIVGVGDASEESAVVRMGCVSPSEMNGMRQAGAVGDILGYFFDSRGVGLEPGMVDRVIGLGAKQLTAIPCVIGVASENGKGPALLGALRSGILDVLATSVRNARHILELDTET